MLGKRIPNLLVVLDSEKGAEFRVQLEVKVKDADLFPGLLGCNGETDGEGTFACAALLSDEA